MDIYRKLKELLDEYIISYENRINTISQKIDGYSELEKIVNLVNNGKDVHLSQVRRISTYYKDLEEYILLLEEVETIILSIKKGHYKEIIPDRIRVILSKCDVPSEDIINVIRDFTLCDKLNSYIKSSSSDDRIKSIVLGAYQYIFSALIKKIQEKYIELGKTNLLFQQKNEYEQSLERIRKISLLFDEKGIINNFEKEDDLEFFHSLIDGKLPSDTIDEILRSIAIFHEKDKTKEEIVEENREK